ncbi:MAG TPA: type II toxin-antitoxin system RelE/ParE family toxin [Pyrinomonadaceae bacterium]|nr:type II toxin-antitoxin system RelE/ParE family toxin [Pyrinomonadaceae bacterium]
MKSGYRVAWTDHALEELSQTFKYLQLNFSEKEISRLAYKIESVISYISKYPKLYPESSQQKGVRRAVIAKFNTLYYRINANKHQIEILSFFSNREDPQKLEF